jgi:hypothetical protein
MGLPKWNRKSNRKAKRDEMGVAVRRLEEMARKSGETGALDATFRRLTEIAADVNATGVLTDSERQEARRLSAKVSRMLSGYTR